MTKNCFIWSRVSTKHQEENGGSLDDQKCRCERFARENGYTIKGYFGGKHESAKTPGKLIKEMIKAVKKDKSVKYIIVNQADRFSRNAGQAINIINDLNAQGGIVGYRYLNTRRCNDDASQVVPGSMGQHQSYQ